MSQAGVLSVTTGGGPVVETLTGNSGGAVGPDGAFNINVVGNNVSGINIVGNPGINTLTVVGLQATTSQRGTVVLATNAQAIAGTDTQNAVTSAALAAKLGTQTAHSLAVFEGTSSALTALGVAGNGQLPIGSVGADPVLATLTAGTGISITNGAGSITIAVNGSVVGETITGNTGGALSPTAGNWNILGSSVAAGTTPVTTSGSVSTLTVDVQTSQAIASTDATKIGLSAFNNTEFTVDANGFVSLLGGGPSIEEVNVQTGTTPIVPSSGAITFNGATVAAGTHPVRTDGTGANTVALEVQISQAIASTDATKIGLAAFNSADFTVDANGFVSFSGTGTTETLTGNSGGAVSPTAGNINVVGTGSITVVGNPGTSTLTAQLTGLTAHNVVLGEGTATVGLVAPSATSGIPFISQGAAADPTYGTAVVAGGGTGNTTFTAYSVICAGTTATGMFQNVSGLGTAGQVLTSNGAAALPTWQASSTILSITSVAFGASPYTVLAADQFLAVQSSGGAITIKLPNAPTTGRVIYIKDSNGAAATNNISVTTVGGTVTIDGQTTYTIVANYGSINVIFDGSNYEVF